MTQSSLPRRIAMWSGPRNLSTALMRSFEARGDSRVVDEPLYAHYLESTGLQHPMREEVLEAGETDWRRVAQELSGGGPVDPPVYYQKHMAHHLLPHIEREWLEALDHAFLIRDPAEMLTSLDAKYPDPALEDTGLPQQVELFEARRARDGVPPPVLDARDVLADPGGVLSALCTALSLDYTERMLSWPEGRRETDGVWASHWYASVEASTGFGPQRTTHTEVPDRLRPLLEEALPYYRTLHAHRLLGS